MPIANTCSIGYPHDGRADNAAYRHDRRADNAANRHDRRADSLSPFKQIGNILSIFFIIIFYYCKVDLGNCMQCLAHLSQGPGELKG